MLARELGGGLFALLLISTIASAAESRGSADRILRAAPSAPIRGRGVAATDHSSAPATGTAFFVGAAGHAVTNAHVVGRCKDLRLETGSVITRGGVVARDPANDLALIKVSGSVTPGLELRYDVRLRERVAIFGYPLREALAQRGRITLGSVTAVPPQARFIETTAHVQAGNSGGPVLDQTGRVVGVVNAKSASRTFAVPSALIVGLLNGAGVPAPPASTASAFTSIAALDDYARNSTARVVCDDSNPARP